MIVDLHDSYHRISLNFINTACCFLLHFHFVSTVDLEGRGTEDDKDADNGHRGEGVVEHDAGKDHGDHLSAGHDDGEHHGPVAGDRVEDEELTHRRADAQSNTVKGEAGVLGHEGEGGDEHPLLQERDAGQEAGEQVHPRHHLDAAHLVLGVEGALPVRGERVKAHVAHEDDEPGEG